MQTDEISVMEAACLWDVRQGDNVIIALDDDGTPTVLGPAGAGDAMAADVEEAVQAVESVAQAVESAIGEIESDVALVNDKAEEALTAIDAEVTRATAAEQAAEAAINAEVLRAVASEQEAEAAASSALTSATHAAALANSAGRAAADAQAAQGAVEEALLKRFCEVELADTEIDALLADPRPSETWTRGAAAEGWYQGALDEGDVLLIYVSQSDHQGKVGRLLCSVDSAETSESETASATAISFDDYLGNYVWHDSLGTHISDSVDGFRNDISSAFMEIVDPSGHVVLHAGSDGIIMGTPQFAPYLMIDSDGVFFISQGMEKDNPVAFIVLDLMTIKRAVLLQELRLGGTTAHDAGKWAWTERDYSGNSHLSLRWIG